MINAINTNHAGYLYTTAYLYVNLRLKYNNGSVNIRALNRGPGISQV